MPLSSNVCLFTSSVLVTKLSSLVKQIFIIHIIFSIHPVNRGRLKRRGPADSAFTTEKLKELNSKRPYPFLSGLLTSSHFRSPHHHPYVTAVDHHPVGKVKTQPTNSYNGSNGYSYFASMESMPYQNGFFNMGSNSLQSNAMQTYNASKGLMIQRPCYSMNSLSTSPPETLAPNAAVSDHSVGKPVMTSSTKNNYSQISNVNVNMQQNTNYFNINGQQGNFQMTSQTSTVPMQANFYGNRSSPFNQGTLRSDAPASYNTSPTAPLSNSAVSSNTQTQAKYESISPPSSGALKSSPESTQTPGGWYQQNCGDYRLTHNYQPTTPQHDHDTRQSTQPTPLQSPETSPPCAYQNRQVTERVVPSNVTVNFNNFGNSHIGIDAPIDFPLSFDFPDITLQNQTQCAQQQTFVNYV